MTRARLPLAALVALLAFGAIGAGVSSPARGATPILTLKGRGFGHGVGLSQWAARYQAADGAAFDTIVKSFYPGVSLATSPAVEVRVIVGLDEDAETVLRFPDGGQVVAQAPQQPPGFPVAVAAGDAVRIRFDGRYQVTQTDAGNGGVGDGPAVASASALRASAVTDGTVEVAERGRRYRGSIDAVASGGTLRLVNQVAMPDYLAGLAEMPADWPSAALQAQAVVSRTYAMRAMQASKEICDYALCQVYVGVDAENPGQLAAVATTTDIVMSSGGKLVAGAVFSPDAGGFEAAASDGLGVSDARYPYLRAHEYKTPNPLPWTTELALHDTAARLGYPGVLRTVQVSRTGPSGRALTVHLDGELGGRDIDGREFAVRLGLRSTLFSVQAGSASTDPPPPAPPAVDSVTQVLPDDGAALAAAAAAADPEPSRTSRAERTLDADAGLRALVASDRGSGHDDLASEPAAWLALCLIAAVTALAMAQLGLVEGVLDASLADRRRHPVLGGLWPERTPIEAGIAARLEARAQRRLERDREIAATQVIPVRPEPRTSAHAPIDRTWSPLFSSSDRKRSDRSPAKR